MPWAHELNVMVVAVSDGRADVEGGIETATSSLQHVGAKVRNRVLHGEPTDELLRYVGEHQPDLVVLGATTLSGAQRLAVESPANVVAHNTQVRCCSPANSRRGDDRSLYRLRHLSDTVVHMSSLSVPDFERVEAPWPGRVLVGFDGSRIDARDRVGCP